MIEIILAVVGIVFLLIASITDFERREVPNWVSFSLIAAGLGVRAIASVIDSDVWVLAAGVVGLVAMGIIGELLYYARQWGGGDTKLLMGVGALFGWLPSAPWFLAHFLVNLVILGAVYGLVWSMYLAIRYRGYFRRSFGRVLRESRLHVEVFGGVGVLLILGGWFVGGSLRSLFLILGALAILYAVLLVFVKTVESSCLFRRVSVGKLVEGDWIAQDVIVRGNVLYRASDPGVSVHQINLLKKYKVNRVLVKDGIPFVPSFFLSLVVTLWVGNLILLVL